MKTYDGPVSDHFDGLTFFDPDGAPPRSLGEVLRWQLGARGQRADWPDWVPNSRADTPPARVEGDKVRLSFVGHASWLIQAGGLNILVDPVWSSRVSPVSFAGPKRHNDPASPSRSCRRSTSCWFRTVITIIWTSRRCRGSRKLFAARGDATRQRRDDAQRRLLHQGRSV
ncbi:hypothetical protein ACQ5SK_20930 [Bradyrhizobium japonicum]